MCFEKICCAQCCCVWSVVSAIILFFLGILVEYQPEFVTTLSKDVIEDSRPAAGHIYGAATMYVFLALISIATLYSGKSFGKSCDSADAKPLLQRLDSDEEGDSPFTAENNYYTRSERKISEEDAAIL